MKKNNEQKLIERIAQVPDSASRDELGSLSWTVSPIAGKSYTLFGLSELTVGEAEFADINPVKATVKLTATSTDLARTTPSLLRMYTEDVWYKRQLANMGSLGTLIAETDGPTFREGLNEVNSDKFVQLKDRLAEARSFCEARTLSLERAKGTPELATVIANMAGAKKKSDVNPELFSADVRSSLGMVMRALRQLDEEAAKVKDEQNLLTLDMTDLRSALDSLFADLWRPCSVTDLAGNEVEVVGKITFRTSGSIARNVYKRAYKGMVSDGDSWKPGESSQEAVLYEVASTLHSMQRTKWLKAKERLAQEAAQPQPEAAQPTAE